MDTRDPALGLVLRFRPARPAAHGCGCELRRVQRAHHDRLLRVETDFAVAVDLVDVATRWRDGQSEDRWVHPGDWELFAAGHRWNDPGRVRALFRLAADLALGHPAGGVDPVLPVVREAGAGRLISDEELIACEL